MHEYELKSQLLSARHPLKLANGHAHPLRALDVTVCLFKHVPGADTLGEGCEGDMGTIYEQNTTHTHTTELGGSEHAPS